MKTHEWFKDAYGRERCLRCLEIRNPEEDEKPCIKIGKRGGGVV